MSKFFTSSVVLLLTLFSVEFSNADTITVGSGSDYDFATISAALAAAGDNEYISIAAGTYTEDLTITQKDLVLTGNSLYPDEVIIKGNIYVKRGADVEIQYMTIDADTKSWGIKLSGKADVKYGEIKNAVYGIVLNPTGDLELYEETIKDNSRHGVYSKSKGKIYMNDSKLNNNSGTAVRVINNRIRAYINECSFLKNKYGVVIKGSSKSVSNQITKNSFTRHNVAIKIEKSKAYVASNTFSKNHRNYVRIR